MPTGRRRKSDTIAGFDIVDRRILDLFPQLVSGLGGDPVALQKAAGLDPEMLGRGEGSVSYRLMADLLALTARSLDVPDFGMRLGGIQANEIRTPLLDLMMSSSTFGEALEQVIRHSYAHSRAAAIWLKIQADEESILVGHDILVGGIADPRQIIEQVLLVEYHVGLRATEGRTRARKVLLRHQPISDPAVYRGHFGVDVKFGQDVDAIVYGAHVLGSRMAEPDPQSCRELVAGIGTMYPVHEQPLHVRVRGLIVHWLHTPACNSEDVARRLGFHCRTLHRRLREQGTSFQAIKDEVRCERLVNLLDLTDLPLSAVSEQLGFAEQSAMTRFSRQVLGMSPRERRLRARSSY
ncbi:AraC family transcriptional regulator [Novosphingobium sp. KA1]|uniref:AraC family transcriptional regulator n=1 Tax=Novosphingobium sp. (strain KA1) TaxID=164608 RepID=UPI001AF07201|nr:AraC family transcriptional regulator [Novosphingobium sp. KA1]QSR19653.1 hypothetical protein CA833_21130 [Novosphingobium sp. KA1]